MGAVLLEGVNTGTTGLTPDERERRRKGKRKLDVSLDDGIGVNEEEVASRSFSGASA